tara:strand:- start:989 stop:1753 length:765 start_codon:yes stop_codon:yes gene_type:complete
MNVLKDKVAIVTGGASGLGKAQALLFAREGAKVVIADLNLKGIEETVAQIRDNDGQAIGIKTDVTSDSDIENLVAATLAEYGKISVLSNTAGMIDQSKNLLETDLSFWQKVLEVNITSLYRVTSKVLPHMLEQKYGVIVNISSGAGLIGGGGGIGYTSTKHAVIGFTKQLNAEFGLKGIRANAIAPGLIQTPMTQPVIEDPNSPLMKTISVIPAGRLGQPDEVADLALFLASDASRYIYGAVVPVDGGLLSTLR